MNDIEYTLLIVVLFIIAVCMFSITVNAPVISEEHMYVSAGVLAQSNTIYKDFSYLQMPYLPLIYSGIYTITGTEYYLLFARIFTFITMFASVVVMYSIGYMITRSFAFSIVGVLFYSFSEITVHSLGHAWNAAPPVIFSLLGVYFFLKVRFGGDVNPFHVFLAGLFVGIAVGIKLFYVTMMLPFILAAFVFPVSYSFWRKLQNSFLPLLVGFVTGMLPVLYYYLIDPESLLFHNIGFHMVNYAWHDRTVYLSTEGPAQMYSVISYFLRSGEWLSILPAFFVLTISVILFIFNFESKKDLYRQLITHKKNFVVSGLLISALLPVLQPWLLWQHYLAYPFPFIILSFYIVYTVFEGRSRRIFVTAVSVATLFVIINAVPTVGSYVQSVSSTKQWTPVQYHHKARSVIRGIPVGEKIAAMEPLIVLEGGGQIYPEYLSGLFLFQVADKFNEEERERYGIISFSSFSEWIENRQPAAIVISSRQRFHLMPGTIAGTGYYKKIEFENDEYSIYLFTSEDVE